MTGDSDSGSGRGGSDAGISRRRLLGLGIAVAAAGGVVAQGVLRPGRSGSSEGPRLLVSEGCLACTGCVVVCPEAALFLEPGCRIAVADDRCTRCGYCVAVCPVDALHVTREAGHA